jgi:hypothetical protein
VDGRISDDRPILGFPKFVHAQSGRVSLADVGAVFEVDEAAVQACPGKGVARFGEDGSGFTIPGKGNTSVFSIAVAHFA